MVRWIAFDDESAEAVVSRYRRGAAEIQQGDPVSAALRLDRESRVLLPGIASGRVLVAHFRPKNNLTANPGKVRGIAADKSQWKNPRSA